MLRVPGSVLADIAVLFASIDAESIMQWSFPIFDLVSFMLTQFVLSAVITLFADTNIVMQ
jgi:hypothetical protein